MPAQVIKISGARQHNLKNLHVEIPREKLVVLTGLSGSGKSSLAFDTLYAEGQRRYVESLSAYARQFLDQMEKPNVDFIEGLSPAIAIEQRSAGASPRSTIATTTEIYDYLRVLFSAVAQPHDPLTGQPLRRQTPQQIVDQILAYEPETKVIVLAPLIENQLGEFRDVIEKTKREGFIRVRIDGQIAELDRPDPIRLKKSERHTIEAVVDRLIVRDGIRVRLTDSIETALKWGGNRVVVLKQTFNPELSGTLEELRYSTDYGNAETGFTLAELTPKHFSFNSHLGACPACHGLGTQLACDPALVISDPGKTLAEGAITPWRRGTKRMQAYYRHLQGALVKHFDVDENVPFTELPERFKEALYFGTGDQPIEMSFSSNGRSNKKGHPFEGLVPQIERLYEETRSELTRNRIRAFMTREPCKVCGGARLKPEILSATIKDRHARELNIHQVSEQTIETAARYLEDLDLSAQQRLIVNEVVHEIQSRLQFLIEVGLGYLTLNRESGTLSGGEAQRIRLATQIGSGLAGVLYVLDEPSIGLHQRDNARLLGTLRRLRDLGNSVIVVEHDEETIRAADHILDLGPGAGPRGGEIVAQGSIEEILRAKNSLTGDYLSGRACIPIPKQRVRPPSINHHDGWLTIVGAAENNLKKCEVCHGKRYNRETLEITYKGKNIADVLDLTVDEAARFFRNVPSVSEKLNSLLDVGLGYLRLGQAGTTLSGGEAQRVKLATELAKKATGRTVYILDEPTTGLHFADIEKLLEVLMKLRNTGNTIVVIEHNLEMIKCADWIIDLGPEGGEHGGEVLGSGSPERVATIAASHTGQYLRAMLERR